MVSLKQINNSKKQKRIYIFQIVIFSIENNYCGVVFSNLSQIEVEPEIIKLSLFLKFII